jgi:translation initiation factor 2A
MPAALFNKKCEKLKDFGTGKRNTVKFSPLGNIITLAGFGNLRCV